ncbi:tRNA (adenosine(37)-N6)-dimethylallyltransferase MiaA [Chloroflexota bacterium]
MKCLIAVVGPTAIGKTKFATHLAQDFNGEIVNADSRQIYRFMDIGTAKPAKIDRALVPYHLIDIVNPDEPFSLALFKQLANKAIEDIHNRGKLPFLIGGSGLYVWSVIEGWQIPEVPPNIDFRQRLENIANEKGVLSLFEDLKKIDPLSSMSIMPTNLRRIIRALEIYNATGKPPSSFRNKKSPPFLVKVIGLTTERQRLYCMIDSRIDRMISEGLTNEVQELIARGYSLNLPAMTGIGYRQIGLFLQNEISLTEAIQKIKYETHQFARRQYTWFPLNDTRIHWFDVYDTIQEPITNLVKNFINSNYRDIRNGC